MLKLRVAFSGFVIDVAGDPTSPNVRVFDPRYRGEAVYRTTSLERAIDWVTAYVDGAAWAHRLAIKPKELRA